MIRHAPKRIPEVKSLNLIQQQSDFGTGVNDSPPAATSAAGPPPYVVPVGDCDHLLGTVKARFPRMIVNEPRAATSARPLLDAASRVQAEVPDYLAALDHLHALLHLELGRRRQLEREVSDVRAALVQARADLAGTRVGERRARHLALHDGLTSLPNRRYFLQRLDQALAQVDRRNSALAVLFIDLDDFKPVNDAHGHIAGDALLRIVAARLARAVRTEDMMSRLGGDEFACLIADLRTRDQLNHLTCKLVDTVSAPLTIGGTTLSVHASIGIAMYPADGATGEALLHSADRAMYHAKQHKTGVAFFDRRIEAKLRHQDSRRLTESTLRPVATQRHAERGLRTSATTPRGGRIPRVEPGLLD